MEAMRAEPLTAAQPASKPERGKKRKHLSDASEPKRSKKNDKLARASSRDDSAMESKSADLLTKSLKRSELNALAAKGGEKYASNVDASCTQFSAEIHLVSGPFTQEERNLVGKLVEDYMQASLCGRNDFTTERLTDFRAEAFDVLDGFSVGDFRAGQDDRLLEDNQ